MEHSLWVEKYRPTDLSTYIGNEHLREKVGVYLESGDVPHLLLYGRAGTGKTTLAKIIVNNIDCDYLYINASDENKVDDVRNKIKTFASSVGFKSLKVIILDECDYLTPNAQAALRNVMAEMDGETGVSIGSMMEEYASVNWNLNLTPWEDEDRKWDYIN